MKLLDVKGQLHKYPNLFNAGPLGRSFFTALPEDSMKKILGDLPNAPVTIELPARAPQVPQEIDTSLMPISGNANPSGSAK